MSALPQKWEPEGRRNEYIATPAVITRLTAEWQADYDAWQKRDLSARRYVYVWADGVYLQARMEEAAECMLVLIGATPGGQDKNSSVAGAPRRHQAAWARDCPGPRGRRRRARLLEGDRTGLPRRQASALLGSHRGPRPALPEGCKVPSRASPYQPGSLGSGGAGQLAASTQTRHVASVPSQEARANAQAVPKGNALAPS
jgi:hypothetical protein